MDQKYMTPQNASLLQVPHGGILEGLTTVKPIPQQTAHIFRTFFLDSFGIFVIRSL